MIHVYQHMCITTMCVLWGGELLCFGGEAKKVVVPDYKLKIPFNSLNAQ